MTEDGMEKRMVNVMVVEDEPAILEGIVQLIKNMKLELQVVSTCFNGKAALEELRQIKVDIIVTDIRMPAMGGLELIEKSQQEYPQMKYVILSGYNEFEYARSAMRFGVEEYILKPPKPSELCEILESVIKKVKDNKRNVHYQSIEKSIFSNTYVPLEDEKAAYKKKSCYLLLFCAGPYSPWAENTIHPNPQIWNKEQIEKKLKKRVSSDDIFYVFDGKMENEKLIFLAAEENMVFLVKQIVNQLSRYERILELPISIVLSEKFHDLEQAREIYKDLRMNMGHGVIIGRSHMIMMDEKNQEKNYVAIDNNDRNNIEKFIECDDISSVISIFRRLCKRWKTEKLSQAICEFSTKYLITEIYRNHDKLKEEYSMENLLYKVDFVIGGASNFEQFQQGIEKIMEELNQKIRRYKTNLKIDDVIELFYEMIQNNYTMEMSTEAFARQFGYNPTYVANMFTSLKKISPNKLITQLRMEKAKELLTDTDYLLKDIAAMMGYHDVSYFSRMFKESMGKSPKQYREEWKE